MEATDVGVESLEANVFCTPSAKRMNILMKKDMHMKEVKKVIRYSCEEINSGKISGRGICVAVLDTGE